MSAFLGLLEIDRFDALKRTIGYAAATALLDALCAEVPRLVPGCTATRADRRTIELILAHASPEEAQASFLQLTEALARRVEIDGYGFDLSVTVGAADAGDRPVSDELVGTAERALATARDSRLPLMFACAEATPREDRLMLMRDLQHAIRDDALQLHYQPKIRARSGETAGAEALVRWTHPERGPIPPDLFIPIAEETGDIRLLTEWVINRAIADQAALLRSGIALPIHVNLSGVLLADPGLGWDLLGLFTNVRGEIGFEITETAMIADPVHALANLRIFADAGLKLAIDDYGAAFSSLAYLQQLPVDELKIDKMFISRLASGQRDPLLVRSTIDLAHALEMQVTAEGVDSPEALALLQVMGCDLLQGYYLSRPIPLADLRSFIARDSERQAQVARPSLHDLLRRRAARAN